MTIQQDELFKAAAHAMLLGCVIPIFGYNIGAGKRRNLLNAAAYTALIGFEVYHIASHIRCANSNKECAE